MQTGFQDVGCGLGIHGSEEIAARPYVWNRQQGKTNEILSMELHN